MSTDKYSPDVSPKKKKHNIFLTLLEHCVAVSVQTIRPFETSVPIRRKLQQLFLLTYTALSSVLFQLQL